MKIKFTLLDDGSLFRERTLRTIITIDTRNNRVYYKYGSYPGNYIYHTSISKEEMIVISRYSKAQLYFFDYKLI